jgi:hypothetical protein
MLALFLALVGIAGVGAGVPGNETRARDRIGASHWQPCYAINATIPVLLDGATSLASMGGHVIKLALFYPSGNYPFNSAWPSESTFSSALSMANHPFYVQVWDMAQFHTFVLVAYSTVGGDAGGNVNYWTKGISSDQVVRAKCR